MLSIAYRPHVFKQLKKLPISARKKITRKIEILATNPKVAKKLKGKYKDYYSFRAWPYRIIYKLTKKTILIYSVVHRQSVYK